MPTRDAVAGNLLILSMIVMLMELAVKKIF